MTPDIAGSDPEQLVLAHRQKIEAAMARHFAGPSEPTSRDRQAAVELVGLLIGSLGRGEFEPPRLSADRNYHVQFGDGLAPILRDVLGDAADTPLLARCIDGFWRLVRARAQSA